jgi:acetyl esterase
MASKFHLLEGISSFQQFVEDPAVADRRKAFDEHPGYDGPAVATRMEEIPGPHGPVPVRIYTPDRAGGQAEPVSGQRDKRLAVPRHQ